MKKEPIFRIFIRKTFFLFCNRQFEKVKKITGLDITFVTSAKTDEESFELLKALGLPFKNQK